LQCFKRSSSLSSNRLLIYLWNNGLDFTVHLVVHLAIINNTLIACGTRQILKNMEFILLCSSIFVIALFSFILLLIDDWRCKSTFTKLLQQPFHQTFYHPSILLYGRYFLCIHSLFVWSEICQTNKEMGGNIANLISKWQMADCFFIPVTFICALNNDLLPSIVFTGCCYDNYYCCIDVFMENHLVHIATIHTINVHVIKLFSSCTLWLIIENNKLNMIFKVYVAL